MDKTDRADSDFLESDLTNDSYFPRFDEDELLNVSDLNIVSDFSGTSKSIYNGLQKNNINETTTEKDNLVDNMDDDLALNDDYDFVKHDTVGEINEAKLLDENSYDAFDNSNRSPSKGNSMQEREPVESSDSSSSGSDSTVEKYGKNFPSNESDNATTCGIDCLSADSNNSLSSNELSFKKINQILADESRRNIPVSFDGVASALKNSEKELASGDINPRLNVDTNLNNSNSVDHLDSETCNDNNSDNGLTTACIDNTSNSIIEKEHSSLTGDTVILKQLSEQIDKPFDQNSSSDYDSCSGLTDILKNVGNENNNVENVVSNAELNDEIDDSFETSNTKKDYSVSVLDINLQTTELSQNSECVDVLREELRNFADGNSPEKLDIETNEAITEPNKNTENCEVLDESKSISGENNSEIPADVVSNDEIVEHAEENSETNIISQNALEKDDDVRKSTESVSDSETVPSIIADGSKSTADGDKVDENIILELSSSDSNSSKSPDQQVAMDQDTADSDKNRNSTKPIIIDSETGDSTEPIIDSETGGKDVLQKSDDKNDNETGESMDVDNINDYDEDLILNMEPEMELTITGESLEESVINGPVTNEESSTEINATTAESLPSSSESATEKPSKPKHTIRVSAFGREMAGLSVSDAASDASIIYSGRPQRKAAKKAESQIREIVSESESYNHGNLEDVEKLIDELTQTCIKCNLMRSCKYLAALGTRTVYICTEQCLSAMENKNNPTLTPPITNLSPAAFITNSSLAPPITNSSLASVGQKKHTPKPIYCQRICAQCGLNNITDKKSLSWETMDFCNEECLTLYQTQFGSHCATCNGLVQQTSLGKYCVRFGTEIKQFCAGSCLEGFKKGLKICSFCQKDISGISESVVLSVGDTGQFKDFCDHLCANKYSAVMLESNPVEHDLCVVCNQLREVSIQIILNDVDHKLCSDVCFAAFKFKHEIFSAEYCNMCQKYFDDLNQPPSVIFSNDEPLCFCSKTCTNMHILTKRKIVQCNWCKVKKYNFDMIRKVTVNGGFVLMCSINCLTLYQVSVNASTTRKIKCDNCKTVEFALYHLTMSDATIRNFCSYNCVMVFRGRFGNTVSGHISSQPYPLGLPKRVTFNRPADAPHQPVVEVTTSTSTELRPAVISTQAKINVNNMTNVRQTDNVVPATGVKYYQHLIVEPKMPPICKNKAIQTCVQTVHKDVEVGSGDITETVCPKIIPIPIPIYVPVPIPVYSAPYPKPVPIGIPIPFPVFLPTTKNTYEELMAEIEKIRNMTPNDPLEADMVMMARRAIEESRAEEESRVGQLEIESNNYHDPVEPITFDDMNSDSTDNDNDMWLKDISIYSSACLEINEESNSNDKKNEERVDNPSASESDAKKLSGKRKHTNDDLCAPDSKKLCNSASIDNLENQLLHISEFDGSIPQSLKCVLAMAAWHQWIGARRDKTKLQGNNYNVGVFNKPILELKSEDLNDLLCLFIREVRKPNGIEYAPDTMYFVCLGIQQYLYENGRTDNLFVDDVYEEFMTIFNELTLKFPLAITSDCIVTRVDEDHLWESRQLGAHTPHVLLNTVMYFNTKYFRLSTIEDHLQLSFARVMRYAKRTYQGALVNGEAVDKNKTDKCFLRYFPPQRIDDFPSLQYREQEPVLDEEKKAKCPVKFFEFYLAKCSESARNRDDLFYLEPEKNCEANSPIWYSSNSLPIETLHKMLNRIKLVREINLVLLGSCD